jgi:hypothetical protein
LVGLGSSHVGPGFPPPPPPLSPPMRLRGFLGIVFSRVGPGFPPPRPRALLGVGFSRVGPGFSPHGAHSFVWPSLAPRMADTQYTVYSIQTHMM